MKTVLGVQIVIWSGLEMNIAIACGSVPAVKPLFTLIFPSLNAKAVPTPRPVAKGIGTSSPQQSSSVKTGSAKSWNPLSSLRKYGHSMDDSLLRTTRNDLELEPPLPALPTGITVERSVEQQWMPEDAADATRFSGFPTSHVQHGRQA